MKEELDLLIIKTNNMNPKEKAAYLVVKYMSKVVSKNVAKECALVAVDEMLNDDWYIATSEDLAKRKEYYNEVKEEIEAI